MVDYHNKIAPPGTYDVCGSGFFISEDGKILTCFHALGGELKHIRKDDTFIAITEGVNEHDNLQTYLSNKISEIKAQLPNGDIVELDLVNFDERYDVALLQPREHGTPVAHFDIDINDTLDYDDSIFFCGYQLATGYSLGDYPFTVNSGQVSSFVDIEVGGGRYQHLQINSINLGGNSGAPLFRQGSDRPIGVINGNMNWGSDNAAIFIPNTNPPQISKASLRTPLSIAFATPLQTIANLSSISGNL